MGISDIIESFIRDAMSEDDYVELQRNELASRFGCVPSQINYVISTRFTNERGYIVESRRGGGGGITIKRVAFENSSPLMHIVNSIGSSIDYPTAKVIIENLMGYGIISEREAIIMCSALTDKVINLPKSVSTRLRADMLKNMLINLGGR